MYIVRSAVQVAELIEVTREEEEEERDVHAVSRRGYMLILS